jgi:hypothetical protein
MVRFVLFACVCVSLFVLTGCAGVQVVSSKEFKMVSLQELQENGESFVDELQGKGRGIIVKVHKGEKIPLKLDAETGVVTLLVEESYLQFERDVYLLISSKGVMVGPDGESFAPIHKLKGLKKVFGLEEGSLSVGLGVAKEDGAHIRIALKAK